MSVPFLRRFLLYFAGLMGAAALVLLVAGGQRPGQLDALQLLDAIVPWDLSSNTAAIVRMSDGSYSYLVNGNPQLFIGMGYNPIYRDLTPEERAASYERDFRILCQAGVNHITGWDYDKGYEQDHFDELTLDSANKYGLGVIMPFYLPPDGDYRDDGFTQGLMEQAAEKVSRFKNHPALRMWGVGNEVLTEMPRPMRRPFARFYVRLADLFHEQDPNHPVIYREAEDLFAPMFNMVVEASDTLRPWLQYGMNVYSLELERILDDWPSHSPERPVFVTEFGAEAHWFGDRALGYLAMWRTIRAHSSYVLGGAPYVWTTEGPEPVDEKWGLMDGNSEPVDDTFEQLAQDWRTEPENSGRNCG